MRGVASKRVLLHAPADALQANVFWCLDTTRRTKQRHPRLHSNSDPPAAPPTGLRFRHLPRAAALTTNRERARRTSAGHVAAHCQSALATTSARGLESPCVLASRVVRAHRSARAAQTRATTCVIQRRRPVSLFLRSESKPSRLGAAASVRLGSRAGEHTGRFGRLGPVPAGGSRPTPPAADKSRSAFAMGVLHLHQTPPCLVGLAWSKAAEMDAWEPTLLLLRQRQARVAGQVSIDELVWGDAG
ncbi:hypothetical protein FA95DRAFT_1285826 [Auriscalpium vulgare]|uniref:Uncharacterized protein n=1 Tax=Auriscalpium vulgare TaxID=40419 RepID=A0ACB8RSK9_9AGAM|nr:hypothetical protein FA95DRAFT_1285826 [Auriscalpium vulgare]